MKTPIKFDHYRFIFSWSPSPSEESHWIALKIFYASQFLMCNVIIFQSNGKSIDQLIWIVNNWKLHHRFISHSHSLDVDVVV